MTNYSMQQAKNLTKSYSLKTNFLKHFPFTLILHISSFFHCVAYNNFLKIKETLIITLYFADKGNNGEGLTDCNPDRNTINLC